MSRSAFKLEEYPFSIRPMRDDEGQGYLIEFQDFPLCIADGATPEQAMANGRDALKCVLETMKEFGDPIPKPGATTQASGKWVQRVPKSLHSRLAAQAEREGVSLNTLVTALVAEGMGRREVARRRRRTA